MWQGERPNKEWEEVSRHHRLLPYRGRTIYTRGKKDSIQSREKNNSRRNDVLEVYRKKKKNGEGKNNEKERGKRTPQCHSRNCLIKI